MFSRELLGTQYNQLIARAKQKARAGQKLAVVPNEPPISFIEFMRLFWPTVVSTGALAENWHIEAMCDHAQKVVTGKEFTHLIVNVPPGSTKTTIFSVMLLPWVWTFWPEFKFLGVGNTEKLALNSSTLSRQIIESAEYKERYPWVELIGDRNTKGFFKNHKGGERVAFGIGGSTTGWHFHLIVIDDPNAADKLTPAYFNSINNEVYPGLTSRYVSLQQARMIVVMQRLHESDLTGHLLRTQAGLGAGQFRHLVIPMAYDASVASMTTSGFIDPRREKGELLDSRRWSAEHLCEFQNRLGIVYYTQQYQQLVTPAEGALFKAQYVTYIDATELPPIDRLRLMWGWDLAQSEKTTADRTAGVLVAHCEANNNFYVLEASAFNKEPGDSQRAIQQIVNSSVARYGKNMPVGVEHERGGAGGYIGILFRHLLPGHQIVAFKPNTNKQNRAIVPAEIFSQGRIKFVNQGSSIILDLANELASFPYGQNDDLVDAFCYAINELNSTNKNAMPVTMPVIRRQDYAS